MTKSPRRAGLAVRGLDSRRFFSLTFLSGLALALAACGNSHEARASAAPSVTAAGPATSLAAIQAKLAGEQAKIAAAVARVKALSARVPTTAGIAPSPFSASGPNKVWNKPGAYRWIVPPRADLAEIAAYGGSGCYGRGGNGGGFLGEGMPRGAWKHPYGESGLCGGGRGGAALGSSVVRPESGAIAGGRGVEGKPVAQNGVNGMVLITVP